MGAGFCEGTFSAEFVEPLENQLDLTAVVAEGLLAAVDAEAADSLVSLLAGT